MAMRLIFFFFLTTLATSAFSQITFEQGYIIDLDGNRIDCFIKNPDWKNNPEEIDYYVNDKNSIKAGNVDNINEFGISDNIRFIKAVVNIDRSSESLNDMSYEKAPFFEEETLFLKVLVEGKASLYSYVDNTISRFFYSVKKNSINQLVYKSYYVKDNVVGHNNLFKQQLWAELQCSKLSAIRNSKLRYIKKDLIKYFISYNECKNLDYISYEEMVQRNVFNLGIKAGLNVVSLATNKDIKSNSTDVSFEDKTVYTVGVNAELVLPFNKNKWSVFIEPTFYNYKNEKEINYVESFPLIKSTLVTIDYNAIVVPLGVNHYFFLGSSSKVFLKAAFAFDIPLKSGQQIKYETPEVENLDVNVRPGLFFGTGYKYKRLGVEMRYMLNRELLGQYVSWSTKYSSLAFLLSFDLLQGEGK